MLRYVVIILVYAATLAALYALGCAILRAVRVARASGWLKERHPGLWRELPLRLKLMIVPEATLKFAQSQLSAPDTELSRLLAAVNRVNRHFWLSLAICLASLSIVVIVARSVCLKTL